MTLPLLARSGVAGNLATQTLLRSLRAEATACSPW